MNRTRTVKCIVCQRSRTFIGSKVAFVLWLDAIGWTLHELTGADPASLAWSGRIPAKCDVHSSTNRQETGEEG